MYLLSSEYGSVGVLVVVSSVLAAIIYGLSYALARQANDVEKASAYECGFDPFEDARNAFDVRFYLVAILFLVFDLEAVFLFPWSTTIDHLSTPGWWTMMEFLCELIVGFIYAWKKGALEWERFLTLFSVLYINLTITPLTTLLEIRFLLFNRLYYFF